MSPARAVPEKSSGGDSATRSPEPRSHRPPLPPPHATSRWLGRHLPGFAPTSLFNHFCAPGETLGPSPWGLDRICPPRFRSTSHTGATGACFEQTCYSPTYSCSKTCHPRKLKSQFSPRPADRMQVTRPGSLTAPRAARSPGPSSLRLAHGSQPGGAVLRGRLAKARNAVALGWGASPLVPSGRAQGHCSRAQGRPPPQK